MSVDRSKQRSNPFDSPVWLVFIISISVFSAEVLVMVLLDLLPTFAPVKEAFVDGAILMVFLVPAFYLFIYRPLVRFVSDLSAAEEKLRDAMHRAESANRAKTEFLANTSHELRTPLNNVIGALDLLRARAASPDQSRYIDIASRSALELLDLIDTVLMFARAEGGEVTVRRERLDLAELIGDLVDHYRPSVEEKKLTMRLAATEGAARYAVSDRTLVTKIMTILLDNAIKFTPAGEIRIAVTEVPGKDARPMIRIAITDTGIGIPEDKLRHIFESFTQVDTSTIREYEGLGLGLALCQKLVDALGGRIGVESTKDVGSTFWFLLQSAPT